MPKPQYLIALVCYVAIPVVGIGGFALAWLIDPEMARHTGDYAANYRLLEMIRGLALMTTGGMTLVLWAATCYFVIASKQRSLLWLGLAVGGPFGLMFLTMLADRSPMPGDLYQQFIRKLKPYWRAALELALFFSAWVLAFLCVVLKSELLIHLESAATGTPVEVIVDRQNASSGMYAFSEALEMTYVFALVYLLWPIVFNLVGQRLQREPHPVH